MIGAMPLIVGAGILRIGADDQKVVAGFDAPVTCSSRKDDHVAGFQSQVLSLRATERDLNTPARNTQHFMSVRMEMQKIVDAVAP